MDGIFVEMDRGGVLTHGKIQSYAYCPYSNLPAFVQANQSFLFTF